MVWRLLLLLALPVPALAGALEEGLRAYEQGEYATAAELLTPLAKKSDPRAQTTLGLMYHYGNGVPEDDKTAFAWFHRAAMQGDAEAQFRLANMYMYNFGVPEGEEDLERQAAYWYHQAATRGHAEAQYTLGLLLLSGTGVILDPEEAMKWIRMAADQGHVDAKSFLGEYAK